MTGTIKALIVDDSYIVRRGIRTLLELDGCIDVVGEADDGDAALHMAEQTSPDIVLLDVRMPKRDGLSVVAALAARHRVLMLTFSDEPATIRSAMDSGAIGYLVHGRFDAESLASTVRSAAAGTTALSETVLEAVCSTGAGPAGGHNRGLSVRQAEVMQLIAEGRSNREIARVLYLTEKTVKNHINQIFAKLGVSSRSQAIVSWLEIPARAHPVVEPRLGPQPL